MPNEERSKVVLESIRMQDVLEELSSVSGYPEEARPGASLLPWHGTTDREFTDFELTGDQGPRPSLPHEDDRRTRRAGFLDDIEKYDWSPEGEDETDE